MPPLCTIFYPLDLQYPIILWLVRVAVSCCKNTALVFRYMTATMNFIVVTTFFHETCRGIFNYLLRVRSRDSSFFGHASVYFRTVETNGWSILYLHCLVWLKERSSFSDLCRNIADKDRFKTRLLLFLDQVIRCKLTPMDTNQVLPEVGSSTLAAKNASIFAFSFKDNANLIVSRVQMYSWTHNATFFKYGHNKMQCWFNFPQTIILNSQIDNTDSIFLQRNNM